LDFSKLFFTVAPPAGGYYAVDKRIYDHVFGDDAVAYDYYKYTEVTVDNKTYIIVARNKADDPTDEDDFYNFFGEEFNGWLDFYTGGFSTIENHQE